jgi:hypothetical protein
LLCFSEEAILLNDNKSLFMGGTIIEVALCVKEKTSQHMVVLGDSMARRFVNNARAEQGVAFKYVAVCQRSLGLNVSHHTIYLDIA